MVTIDCVYNQTVLTAQPSLARRPWRSLHSPSWRSKTRTRSPSRSADEAEAVVLDLVRPLRSVGHVAREGRPARCDEAFWVQAASSGGPGGDQLGHSVDFVQHRIERPHHAGPGPV